MSNHGVSEPLGAALAGHLVGRRIPPTSLQWILGQEAVDLATLGREGTMILHFFAGNEPEADFEVQEEQYRNPDSEFVAGFRDFHFDFTARGAAVVGISSRPATELRELSERILLPGQLLSDPGFSLSNALRVPTHCETGVQVYQRLVTIAVRGQIRWVSYPIAPQHASSAAEEALRWIERNAPR
jgi:peroxiredoxin